MNDIFISLVNNAALLLSLGLIYDLFYHGKQVPLRVLNKLATGLIIGIIAIVLMATPAKWESGIIFDTRTILLGLTGLFFGTLPAHLAMTIAAVYRLRLGGGGALMGVATIVSSGLIGLLWRHYRFSRSRELSLSELYLFGVVVHAVMILCMFFLPQEVIQKTIRTLALPVILIYPIGSALLGNLLTGRQRRYRLETELRESTQRFSLLAEQSLTVTWEIDAAGLYTYVSPVAESVFGYRPEELVGKVHFYELHPEEGRAAFRDAAFAILRSKTGCKDLLNPIQTKSGKIIWVSTTGLPILDRDGALAGFRGSDKDVSDRKLAEEALRESEDRFRSYVVNSPQAIFVCDEKGFYKDVNPAACRMTGYTVKELLTMSLPDLLPPESTDWLDSTFRQIAETGRSNGETAFMKKNGERGYWSLAGVKLSPVRFMAFVTDITERRKVEEDKLKLESQLLQSQKMESIGTFAGGVAHDFNNILTAIIGYGNMALMKMAKDDPLRSNMAHILEASDRAAHLTKDLLLFSRKQPIDRKPLDLNEVVQKLGKFLLRVIGEDIDFKTLLSGGVIPVFADENQIGQVLMNLTTNARDAMPKGGTFTISTQQVHLDKEAASGQGLGEPGRYALISVSDTGQGMAEETRKRIFEPFYTTKEVGKGTGLGLAVVYGIVSQHDGHISVYSEPGQGTTFKIYLPLIPGGSDNAAETPAEEPPAGGTETILLAEDNEAVRNLTVAVLTEFGYTVVTANDGEDAVTKYRENSERIQLLLFDLIMPKKTGKEAYDEIRKLRPDIKVIFASGYSEDIIQDKASLGNDSTIIFKPVTPMDLLRRVRTVLDKGKE